MVGDEQGGTGTTLVCCVTTSAFCEALPEQFVVVYMIDARETLGNKGRLHKIGRERRGRTLN